MQVQKRMYEKTKTWNPAVGCKHGCIYCVPTFQKILKRQPCDDCKSFKPHYHPERLKRIPSGFQIIFVFGNGDIAFYDEDFVIRTLFALSDYIERHPNNTKKTFYFQSKDPICFEKYLDYFKAFSNIVLLTTLETNRSEGYSQISKAPPPSVRAVDFHRLNFPRKIITVEPILDFDLGVFSWMLMRVKPERVYMGYNSRPNQVKLAEPSLEKFFDLKNFLISWGVEVVLKNQDRLRWGR